jgi:L-threonylcarbamoyladenylate synthase
MDTAQSMSRKKASPPWKEDALKAIACLRSGGVCLHATDTVWGLAADATQSQAVERISQIKARPIGQPMLMLVSSERMVEMLQPNLPEEAWELLEVSDRPVTIIAPSAESSRYDISPSLRNESGACAVRYTQDPYCQFIIEGLGRPIVSSSANKTGDDTPSLFKQISPLIKADVDYIGTYGQDIQTPRSPSILVSFDKNNRFQIIRS